MAYEWENEYDFFEISCAHDDGVELNNEQQQILKWMIGFHKIAMDGRRNRPIEDDNIFQGKRKLIRKQRLKYEHSYFQYVIEQLLIKIETMENRYKTFSSVFRELFLDK